MSPDFAGWLDDIGLPQYKDQFHESRVDGRMLQYLTVVRIFSVNISIVPVRTQFSCNCGGASNSTQPPPSYSYSLEFISFVM